MKGVLMDCEAGSPGHYDGSRADLLGRYLWQLDQCETLLVAWKVEPDFAGTETDLIEEFMDRFGSLPFANLKRGDRRRT
jgi:hypothetical protein